MKKKILLLLSMVIMLACVLAISISAASTTGNIDYNEEVTLADGTVLPIYDENRNPLIWYISGTKTESVEGEDVTKNVYSSVVSTATKDSPDANGYYVSYVSDLKSFTGPTGEKLNYYYSREIWIKHTSDTSVNFKGDDTMVVANLRGVEKVGDIQGGTIDKLQYFFAPRDMIRSGDFRTSQLILADFTQSINMRMVISQAFSSGVAGKIKEVRFPTIEPEYDKNGMLINAFEIGNYAFQNCKLITALDFPETLYKVGNNAFQNCNNLTDIGDTPNLSIINADAFENCWVLTGLDFANTKLTSIGARAFRYAGLQDNIEFPSTLTSIGDNAFYRGKLIKAIKLSSNLETLGNQVFREIGTLEYFDFNGFTLEVMEDYFLWKCSELRAISLPEGLKSFGKRPFEGCTKLEVVYLPDSLTTLTWFQKATKLYFVQDSFSINWEAEIFDSEDWNGQKPEKPSIYYMPESLVSFSVENNVQQSDLHTCTGINDTVVFPVGIKEIPHQYTFFAISDKNFVFLGEVTLLNVNSSQKSNYYFMNDAVTAETLELQGNGSHNLYFHSDGVHLTEKTGAVAPTCTENEKVTSYCFCGEELGTSEVENTALGHSHTIYLGLIYESFDKEGAYSYKCERCDDVNKDEVAPALFTCRGYSVPENGNGGITFGYVVNYDAIEYYEQLTGKTVRYGVFAVLKDRLGSNDIFDAEGKTADGVISADLSASKFTVFQLKIVGFKDEQKDVKLAMGAYVAVTENGETTYSYMQYGDVAEGEKYAFASYNDVLQIVSENNKAE